MQEELLKTQSQQFKTLKSRQQELATGKGSIEQLAQAGDYKVALDQVADLSNKASEDILAFADMRKAKEAYDTARKALGDKLGQTQSEQFKALKPKQQELAAGKASIEPAVQNEDYKGELIRPYRRQIRASPTRISKSCQLMPSNASGALPCMTLATRLRR